VCVSHYETQVLFFFVKTKYFFKRICLLFHLSEYHKALRLYLLYKIFRTAIIFLNIN